MNIFIVFPIVIRYTRRANFLAIAKLMKLYSIDFIKKIVEICGYGKNVYKESSL